MLDTHMVYMVDVENILVTFLRSLHIVLLSASRLHP